MKRFDSAKAFRERLAKRKKTRAAAAVAEEARARQAEEQARLREQLKRDRELAVFMHRTTIRECGPLGDVDVVTTYRHYKTPSGAVVQRPLQVQRAMMMAQLAALAMLGSVPMEREDHDG